MHSAVRQAEMYGAIGEEDVLAGLWKRRCRTENTRAGEMLMQVSAILHCRMSNVIVVCDCILHVHVSSTACWVQGQGHDLMSCAWCRWDFFLQRRTSSLTPAASRLHLTHVRSLQPGFPRSYHLL